MNFFEEMILSNTEAILSDAKNKINNLLTSILFCNKHEIANDIIKNLDKETKLFILYKISNFYEPVAEYLEEKKRQTWVYLELSSAMIHFPSSWVE